MNSVIVAARRTAVVPRGGAFSALNLHQLATPVIRACLMDCGIDPAQVDELIAGNALGAGGNPARVLALAADLPQSVAGLTIDRQCCSGLDALLLADAMIGSGAARIVVAGGVESYSQRPQRLRMNPETRLSEAYEQPPFTPWPERDPDMAEAADALADSLGIDAREQNAWAMESHRKAIAEIDGSGLQREIVPINGVERDPFSRHLSPALCQRARCLTGNITSANTAVAADAAAFCVIVEPSLARGLGLPGVRLQAGRTLGANPDYPGSAPVAAMRQVIEASGLDARQLHRAEIMEAYAAQAIACVRLTDIDPAVVNVSGGALARGHPIGASGAVLAVRLFSELSVGGGYGLASIAAAGGLGTAVLMNAD